MTTTARTRPAAVSAAAKLVIEKADAGLTVDTAINKTYGDESFALSAAWTDSSATASYTSSDTDVATVDESGAVTLVGAGKATITVSVSGTANYKSGSAEITLTVAKKNSSLTVEKAVYQITYGDSFTISAASEGGTVSYTSSDTDVVTVDSNGTVESVGVGTADIKLSIDESSNYNASSLTVAVDVSRAQPSIALPDQESVYTGTAAEAAAVVTLVNDENYTGAVTYVWFTDSSCTTMTTATDGSGASDEGAAPVNAGTYYAKASIEEQDHYFSAESDTAIVTIKPKTVELSWSTLSADELVYDGTGKVLSAEVANKAAEGDNVSVTVEPVGDNVNVTADGFYYTATGLTGTDSGNYRLPSDTDSDVCRITAASLSTGDFVVTQIDGGTAVTLDTDGNASINFTGSAIEPVVAVAGGSLVASTPEDYTVSYGDNTAVGTGTVTITGQGNFTGELTYTFHIVDQVAPADNLTVAENTWNTFWNTVTFGLFFNETQTVAVTASDGESGVAKTEYYLANAAVENTDDLAEAEWTEFTGSFNIDPENSYVVYVRITDNSGNSTIINSDGIVLDTTAPEITGLADQGAYCADVSFTVTDSNLDYVTVNGVTVTDYTLEADGSTYEVIAYDKAGNSTAYTVTVNSGHTSGEVVKENEVAATCTSDGSYDSVVYCTVCGQELSRETVTVLATGGTSSGGTSSGIWKHGLVLDADEVFRYYQNNVFAKDYVGVVPYDGSLFFIKNGLVDFDANGLCLYEDVWYFVSLGQVQLQYTGLALYDGAWFCVTDGVLDTAKNGFVSYDGERFLVAAGKLLLDYNGLWLNDSSVGGDDCWYFLAVGMVQNVSGVVMYDGAWFVIADGKLDTDYNGPVIYDGAEFTVVNGQLQL